MIDTQYRQLLEDILDNGIEVKSQSVNQKDQVVNALTIIGAKPMRFKLSDGFPVITERKISPFIWKSAIGELLGFINGARTQEQLESYGCKWWKPWVTERKCHKRGLETGDLGPGSYGAAFHDFPTAEGETYNQFANMIQQIKEQPHLRTHFISPWVPQFTMRVKGQTQKVVVCPCHGWIHIRILNGKLYLHMFQRSGDVPIGVPANMIQYAGLTMMLAEVTGYQAAEYIHTISDAHIYVDQVEMVKDILKREPRPLPKMILKKKRKNLFDYRPEDFELVDYDPHPAVSNIPVAV